MGPNELRTSEEERLAAMVILTDFQDWGDHDPHASPLVLWSQRHCEMSTCPLNKTKKLSITRTLSCLERDERFYCMLPVPCCHRGCCFTHGEHITITETRDWCP